MSNSSLKYTNDFEKRAIVFSESASKLFFSLERENVPEKNEFLDKYFAKERYKILEYRDIMNEISEIYKKEKFLEFEQKKMLVTISHFYLKRLQFIKENCRYNLKKCLYDKSILFLLVLIDFTIEYMELNLEFDKKDYYEDALYILCDMREDVFSLHNLLKDSFLNKNQNLLFEKISSDTLMSVSFIIDDSIIEDYIRVSYN